MSDLEEDLRAVVAGCITKAGVSRAHVARQIGITAKHMSQMLTGKAPLSVTWAERIAEVCGRELRITSVRRRRRAGEPAVEVHEPTAEEWDATVAGHLADLGCTAADLEAMAATGDFPTQRHRQLWLTIKPQRPE